MTTIRWAPQATISRRFETSSRATPRTTRSSCVSEFLASIEQLALFPLMGRVIPELAMPDVRDLIVAPYRIVYRVRGDTVEIATIFHAARLLPLKM